MTTGRVQVAGPVPATAAWDRYDVIARWPLWAPHMTAVESSGRRLRPGVTGVVHGAGVRAGFTVLDVDERARTWTWEVTAGPLRLRLRHDITAGGGGGCVAGLDATGPLPLVLAYRPLAWWALHRLVHLPVGTIEGETRPVR